MTKRLKRSGNGYNGKQDLYLFVYLPIPLWVKIGISRDGRTRSQQVSRSIPGWAVQVCRVRVRNAYAIEQSLHRALCRFRLRFPMPGDGGTEWFWFVAALPWFAMAGLAWLWDRIIILLLLACAAAMVYFWINN